MLPLLSLSTASLVNADDHVLHSFARQQLTDQYYSEGLGVGDLNRDGQPDVVYGPYWFAGPKFEEKHEIYTPKPQNKEGYADHFFAWVRDFNGDGWNDILTAGFPGTPGFVYENPGKDGHDKHWVKHQVLDHVSNESPQFTNLVGDASPELVCSREGYFGYATPNAEKPLEPWAFHPISGKVAPIPFGHGLGVGDVNGDGRMDLLIKDGWFEQPATLDDSKAWAFHAVPFAPIGGADIYAYDVDGDGDNDVITSLAAHDFGLAWYEQKNVNGAATFERRLIMGDQPEQSRYGLVFSEPHSVMLADIDGDGLKDIVTGKTYYSHHKASPMWDAGAVVYWFRLTRTPQGVDWVPYRADGEAGIGRQLAVVDLNNDGLLDLASGGMKGAHVMIHRRDTVDEKRWREAQPSVYTAPPKRANQGPKPIIDDATGRVSGAIEAESLAEPRASGGKTGRQSMAGFKADRWSGGEQLFWTGAKPGDRLELPFEVSTEGTYDLNVVFTLARDYATLQPALDGETLGAPLDLYHYPEVLSSGELTLASRKLARGTHRLSFEILGANPAAVRAFMVGIDYLRLVGR